MADTIDSMVRREPFDLLIWLPGETLASYLGGGEASACVNWQMNEGRKWRHRVVATPQPGSLLQTLR